MKPFIATSLAGALLLFQVLASEAASYRRFGEAASYRRFGAVQSAGTTEQRCTWVIHSDGSNTLITESAQKRKAAEQDLKLWQQWQAQEDAENDEAENDNQPTEAAKAGNKPISDEELAQQYRDWLRRVWDDYDSELNRQVEGIDIDKDVVRIRAKLSFASLEDLFSRPNLLASQAGLPFDNVRLETDSAGKLRVTLSPGATQKSHISRQRQQWKLSGSKLEFKITLPGKVLTSTFPHAEGNSTWILLDGKESESLEAALKVYETETVITAEPGGLKLPQPIESKNARPDFSKDTFSDLPINDAGPGYAAEAVNVTTAFTYFFPQGQAFATNLNALGIGKNGTTIQARLFPPKQRILRAVTDVRVLSAVDDKGRPVPKPATPAGARDGANTNESDIDPDDDVDLHRTEFDEDNSSASLDGKNAARIRLSLGLPAPDAQSIEEVAAEAIVLTAGSWKSTSLTSLSEIVDKEQDLASVLEGARVTVTKFRSRNSQVQAEIRITGPPAVRRLDVSLLFRGSKNVSSSTYDRNVSIKGNQCTRRVTVQAYTFDKDKAALRPELQIRFPEDFRRERVKFKLTGLDLL